MRADPGETANVLEDHRRPLNRLRQALEAHGDGEAAAPSAVDPEEAARLAALGYLTSSAPESEGPRADPKDALPALAEISAAAELAKAGLHEEAVPRLEALVERFPGMMDGRVQLASSLRALGRPEEALAQYQAALEERPAAAGPLLVKIAEIYLSLGQVKEAAEHARAAVDPEPVEAWSLLSRIALARGESEEAVRALRRSLEAAGGARPELEVLLARTQITAGDPAAALETLDALRGRRRTAGRPLPAWAEFLRGDLLARAGRTGEAEAAFRSEIDRFPRHSQAYANLAVLYASLRRFSEIEPLLQAMVAARPEREVFLLAAETAERLGDTEGAAAWRRRAPAAEG